MAYGLYTKVPFERTTAEIIALLKKAGADRIGQAEEPGRFAVQCFLNGRLLRFAVDVPEEPQPRRQRGRALLLVIKAKLESTESGVETFEQAFLANVVMPDGQTIADKAVPLIAEAYASGKTPQLMLMAQ
jgi:hypothetical protein